MRYFKFEADTPICGTENVYFEKFPDDVTEETLNDFAVDYAQQNGESFSWGVFGWHVDPVEEGEMTEEEYQQEMEFYWEGCICDWEEISEEEYLENV